MRKISFVIAAAVLAGTGIQVASAHDMSSGCGLGWEVSQKQSLLSSAIRSTTNTILPNTISMTFGTSGCAQHTVVKNDEKAVLYAVNNYDTLLVEMAQGRGEFLNGFAESLGCDKASFAKFDAFTQSHYPEIIESSSHDGIELYRAVRTKLQATDLGAACVPNVSI